MSESTKPGLPPVCPVERRSGADGMSVPDERQNALQAPTCDHWYDDGDVALWLCGCGDGMTDETHARQGCCDTCVMFDHAKPCDGVSPSASPQEDAH